jgi:hypothetical protein
MQDEKKTYGKVTKLSGDQAKQLAQILGVKLPSSGEVSVFHSGQGLEAGDYLAELGSVLKKRDEFRIVLVADCW